MHIVMERNGVVLDMNLEDKDKDYLEQLKKEGYTEKAEQTQSSKIMEASVISYHKEKK